MITLAFVALLRGALRRECRRRLWPHSGFRSPAARLARILGESFDLGIEYYTDLGPLQSFVPFNEQQHNIYAVVDFKIGRFDVNAGVGYGLTPGSDRLMAKMIIGTDLNEGEPTKSLQAPRSLRRADILGNGVPRP